MNIRQRVTFLENVFFYYYSEGQAVKMAKMKDTVLEQQVKV